MTIGKEEMAFNPGRELRKGMVDQQKTFLLDISFSNFNVPSEILYHLKYF